MWRTGGDAAALDTPADCHWATTIARAAIPMTPARPCAIPSGDINARIPPSPSLSARMNATHMTDVVIIGVQTINDSISRAAAGVASPTDHSSTVLRV